MAEDRVVLSRRVIAGTIGGALLLAGCNGGQGEKGIVATEDLMREHGVLRRIIVVYRESAAMLRSNAAAFDAGALAQAADLFRRFGEEYHERKLEEQHVFPAVQKAGGEAAGVIGSLLAQHQRGREVTGFIWDRTASGKVDPSDAGQLAGVLEAFARMYEVHTAFEDTIVFQAWRKTMSAKTLDQVSDQFEDIERKQFNGDGFDMAVDEIKAIEQRLGLYSLDRYTAPVP